MKRFAIVIEDAGTNLAAYVPDLPGCMATGESGAGGGAADPGGDRPPSGGDGGGRVTDTRTVEPCGVRGDRRLTIMAWRSGCADSKP